MPELKIEDLDHTDVFFCALLRRPRGSTNNPRLSALAVKVRLDVFTKVKKAIEDEIKHKNDFLVEERMSTATKNSSNTAVSQSAIQVSGFFKSENCAARALPVLQL